MWFIKKKINIVRSGTLQGMVDTHSHLIWGVDDGSKDVQRTEQMIASMKNMGIKSAFATPHLMSNLTDNTTERLLNKFNNQTLPAIQSLGFELRIAGEYMLDEAFAEKFSRGDLLTYDGKHMLVEISTMAIPTNLEESIFEICSGGYIPVFAHPERCNFQSKEKYDRLISMGCKFQLNILSLSDYYGKSARERAESLLEAQMYDFIGTDAHSPRMLEMIENMNVSSKLLLNIKKLVLNNNNLL